MAKGSRNLTVSLLQWFNRFCLPEEWHAMTLGSVRLHLLLTPGQFVRAQHRPILRLPASFPDQDAWRHALKTINRLKP